MSGITEPEEEGYEDVFRDPLTVTASFNDVAQVVEYMKAHGKGEPYNAACRLLDTLRDAKEGVTENRVQRNSNTINKESLLFYSFVLGAMIVRRAFPLKVYHYQANPKR